MNTVKDVKNDLLNRREIKIIIEADSNPGNAKAVQIIADEFKSSPENIVIKTLKSKFGRNTFLLDAFIYNSAKDKERIELKKKVKKDAAGGAK